MAKYEQDLPTEINNNNMKMRNIELDWDTDDGFFASLIRRSILFIKEKHEFFKAFKYKYRGLSSYTVKSVNRVDTGQGEEEVEEITTEERQTIGAFNANDKV
ncbi:4102_t:CDS:2 [Gigaspora rosea]|nr:4102_t:CDS:2 [Gigaspora rosea]